mgnify:CR=1 FL=1
MNSIYSQVGQASNDITGAFVMMDIRLNFPCAHAALARYIKKVYNQPIIYA